MKCDSCDKTLAGAGREDAAMKRRYSWWASGEVKVKPKKRVVK